MATRTLSVRLRPETRRVLDEAAGTHDTAGASALARDILERWAEQTLAEQRSAGLARAGAYLRSNPDWDEPSEFFHFERP